MAKPAPAKPQRVWPLLVGVVEGAQGDRQMVRAEQILKRNGFKVGIASPETLRLLIQRIDDGTDQDPTRERTE